MKIKIIIAFTLFILVFPIYSVFSNFKTIVHMQQESNNQKRNAKLRNEWLKKVPLPKNATELEFKFSFPTKALIEKDIYLWGARHMATDSSGNIYVSSSKAHQIFKFDSSGNFLQKFGRKGQGPGEFNYGPFNINVTKNFIITNETGRIQFFEGDGKHVKSLKLFKKYRDMVINDEGVIFAAPGVYRDQSKLIDVISNEGKLLYSFGKLKKFNHSQSQLNRVKLTLNQDGDLFAAYVHFPIICKYTKSGELLDEFRIEHKAIKTQEDINKKRISSQTQGRTGFAGIISAIDAIGDRVYILHTVPRIKIFEFDNTGKQKSIFWYIRPYGYTVWDFLIQNRDNKKVFYFLTMSPDNKIEVFDLKQ